MGYLHKTRLGQTEHGSFVVRVLSKVSPPVGQDPDTATPFEREVTLRLSSGLSQTESAAVKVATSDVLDWIEGAVAKGLSANLCDSIAQMGSDEGDREIRIAISWAASRQLPAEVPSSFLFAPDTLDYVKSTGQYLKKLSTDEDFELEGIVTRMAQAGSGEDVIVKGLIDGHERRNSDDVAGEVSRFLAIRAYDERMDIRCKGNLIHEKSRYRLAEVKGFELIDSGDEGGA